MSTCPSCQHPATKRDGYDVFGRQRYHCRPCHRDFTVHSTSAFSGYRWPPDVLLMAVRWYCSLPLSAAQVVRLLAERHIDVTARTVLNWVQTFGPQLAAALRLYRRRVGRHWTVDEGAPRTHSQNAGVRCCTEDEDRPLGAGVQAQAQNRLKLHTLRACVVSVEEKELP